MNVVAERSLWLFVLRGHRMTLGPTQTPVQWGPGPFPGDKPAGRGVDYPPSSSTEVK